MPPVKLTPTQYARLVKSGKFTPAMLRGQAGQAKYHNRKVEVDGIKFDSGREASRYRTLWLMLQAGAISDLRLQTPFVCEVNGKRVCAYYADFTYRTASGERVIEDAKGMKTPVYRLKKKLVEAIHGITIREV
jgi:hypothetical protein